MDNALLFSDSFRVTLILDTYRSERFNIVKSVGEHQLNLPRRIFRPISLLPGISMSGLKKTVLNVLNKGGFCCLRTANGLGESFLRLARY